MSFPGTLASQKASSAGAPLPAAPDLAAEQAAPKPARMAQSKLDCRSPVGLDCCNCCLDLANRSNVRSGSPTVSNFRQLQEKLIFENLNADKLDSIMQQDSLEPVLQDPCYLINEGICNRNIDQTMLSILLFFHRWVAGPNAWEHDPADTGLCWILASDEGANHEVPEGHWVGGGSGRLVGDHSRSFWLA